jgi:hypothetical protein
LLLSIETEALDRLAAYFSDFSVFALALNTLLVLRNPSKIPDKRMNIFKNYGGFGSSPRR